ncbi:MAG: hypothetical protein II663_08695, partial [Bacteroidales bacterium]|nr:hypothetical protein [Bacteroidales bacterium]
MRIKIEFFSRIEEISRFARKDVHLGQKEKKKGKNCSAIFPFLFNPSKPRHAERSEASHNYALSIKHCALNL